MTGKLCVKIDPNVQLQSLWFQMFGWFLSSLPDGPGVNISFSSEQKQLQQRLWSEWVVGWELSLNSRHCVQFYPQIVTTSSPIPRAVWKAISRDNLAEGTRREGGSQWPKLRKDVLRIRQNPLHVHGPPNQSSSEVETGKWEGPRWEEDSRMGGEGICWEGN